MSTSADDTVAFKSRVDPVVDVSDTAVLSTATLLREVRLPEYSVLDDKDVGNVDDVKFTPGVTTKVTFLSTEALIKSVVETLIVNNAVEGIVVPTAVIG